MESFLTTTVVVASDVCVSTGMDWADALAAKKRDDVPMITAVVFRFNCSTFLVGASAKRLFSLASEVTLTSDHEFVAGCSNEIY